jgi:hypothetical protein
MPRKRPAETNRTRPFLAAGFRCACLVVQSGRYLNPDTIDALELVHDKLSKRDRQPGHS